MTNHLLEIFPGVGFGPVRIGMRPFEVQEVFREPEAYEEWMGGNLNDALLYQGLRLHFNSCDSQGPLFNSKLTWIVIHQREDAAIFGRRLMEWTKDEILRELVSMNFDVRSSKNGDIDVPDLVGLSFDDNERLDWVEVVGFRRDSLLKRLGLA